MNTLVIDTSLLRRFDKPGPRYTSYPTADRFVDAYDADTHRRILETRRINVANRGLSLYVHLPFCNTVCYYCGCNKIVTRDHSRAAKYLRYLEREIGLVADAVGSRQRVTQLHLGGGTPTFLSAQELRDLLDMLHKRFEFAPDAECSIEIDPRSVDAEKMATLGELGFNRVSIGVQDFDADVQKAVNRIQSYECTQAAIEQARAFGCKSVNLDLIYGLPLQTPERFAGTLDKVMQLRPERVALYQYAHLPHVFKPQRRIREADLPDADGRMALLQLAVSRLQAAGYRYIGMDHFALPEDELAKAQDTGKLHRNFQGYSTRAECDLIAFGVSAISAIGASYSQNVKSIDAYYDALDQGLLPVMRGVELDSDDLVRRAVIQSLMCRFEVSTQAIEESYLVQFRKDFAVELDALKTYVDLGLVEIGDEWISITQKGRMFVRAIAMTFDRYLRNTETRARYSKVV